MVNVGIYTWSVWVMAFDRIMRNYNTRSGLSQDWRKPFDRYEVLVNIIYQGENKKTPAVWVVEKRPLA